MNIELEPGTYVLAVSGGVDSMVLLDLLAKSKGRRKSDENSGQQLTAKPNKLIIAHYDHGIRQDSQRDRLFVQEAASKYGLPFVFDLGSLGPTASEDQARVARYAFLKKVKSAAGAKAIITAHHQDDAIETAIINILRGTNRRGLTSLQSRSNLLRPLLATSKSQLVDYAKQYKIKWREDITNKDTKYLRNYVRHNIVPLFSSLQRQQFITHLDNLTRLNKDLDQALVEHLNLHLEHGKLNRTWFVQLPHNIAREVIVGWLRQNGAAAVDKKRLELLVRASKTYAPGQQIDVDKQHILEVGKDELALGARER